jgi:hypothetical protein
MDQGWYVELTERGHCKWYKKFGDGKWMWSSTTEKNYDKILKDLVGFGLEYPPPPPIKIVQHAEAYVAEEHIQEEKVVVTRRTVNRVIEQGAATRWVTEWLHSHVGHTARVSDVWEWVRVKLPEVQESTVGAALRGAERRGEVSRPARGLYHVDHAPTGERAPRAPRNTAPVGAGALVQLGEEEQELVAEEQAIMAVMQQALVDLEALFARRRAKLGQLLRVQKLLKGALE